MALLGLGLVALTPAQAAERPAVTGVRAADHDGVTRVVLDLSAEISFQSASDGDARHLAILLPEVDWRADAVGARFHSVGLVRSVSFAIPAAGSGRLLLETSRPAVIRKMFLLPPSASSSYRLVLDLEPTSADGGAAVAAGALPPRAAVLPLPPRAAVLPLPPRAAALPLPPRAAATASPAAAVTVSPAAGLAAAATAHQDGPALQKAAAAPPPPAPPLILPASASAAPPRVVSATVGAAAPTEPGRKERHAGRPIVVIDPGHGGVDPGATSVSGAYEKNIVLALARDLKEELDRSGKVTCILTRDRDIFIPLRERVAMGRAANADLFLSLHADTVNDADIHGLSVYTLSQNASDAEAQALADKENKADIVAGLDLSNESPEVTNILIDLVQRESMNLSARFAHQLIGEVSKDTHQLLQNTHRFAGFAVLKAPDVASVLVESGYLSNARDEQLLRRPEYRAKLASALARAIEGFLVRPAKVRRS
jgi:N-acetylmuramoyl-L-alanine amidase